MIQKIIYPFWIGIGITLAILLGPAWVLAQPEKPQVTLYEEVCSDVGGRFQLFQGKTPFTQIDENRTENATFLFKIDTLTGEVWMFQGGISKEKTIAQWQLIKD